MKTVKEYLNSSNHCPNCNSEWIEGCAVDIHVGSASQDIFCNDCDQSWIDYYTLTNFELFGCSKEKT